MRRQREWRHVCATLAVCSLACAPHGDAALRHAALGPTSPIVVTFGSEGGNMLPLRVTIDARGAVAISAPGRTAPPSVRLSQDALDGLRMLAAAEGFAAMPPHQIGHGLPDVGGRFIGVRVGGALKVVQVRYVRNRAFDQLYAVLSAAVGLPS